MYVVGWFVYLLFGSGTEQSWNTPYEVLLVSGNMIMEPKKSVVADTFSINNADNDHIVWNQSQV